MSFCFLFLTFLHDCRRRRRRRRSIVCCANKLTKCFFVASGFCLFGLFIVPPLSMLDLCWKSEEDILLRMVDIRAGDMFSRACLSACRTIQLTFLISCALWVLSNIMPESCSCCFQKYDRNNGCRFLCHCHELFADYYALSTPAVWSWCSHWGIWQHNWGNGLMLCEWH